MKSVPTLRQIQAIEVRFSGGPLHGQRATVNIDQHVYTYRPSKTEYRLITHAVGRHLIPIYVARGQTPQEQADNLTSVLAIPQ